MKIRYVLLTALVALLVVGTWWALPRVYGIDVYRHDKDFPTISKILTDDWYWLVSEDSVDFSPEFTFSHRTFSREYPDGSLQILVYRVWGKVAAFLTYFKTQNCRATIQFVAVGQEYRRKGYAQALIERMLHRAASEGICSFDLTTRVSNTKAQRLYQQYGFEKTWEHDGFVGYQKFLMPSYASA